MKLLGSMTSPYVRRIRLLCAELYLDYQFENIDVFSPLDRARLKQHNPALKVPTLTDGELCLYDSRVISRYLCEKVGAKPLTWRQENLLTLIDAANDSLVALLISKRSGIDVNDGQLFFTMQHERIETSYQQLAQEVSQGAFAEWSYPAICLYCLLDWADFRALKSLAKYPALANFVEQYRHLPVVMNSDPRH